ncbi:MAG: ComF family protein [Candidatus Spyradosoma sp.]
MTPPFPKLRAALADFFGGALDTLFPRSCLVTGEPTDGRSGASRNVSEAGAAKLFFLDEACACSRCGAFGGAAGGETCRSCARRDAEGDEFQFGRSRSVVALDDSSRPIVVALKYRGLSAVARDMAALARRSRGFAEHLAGATLVPVPLHASRLRRRGYNQSLHLARAFAEIAPGATVADLLARTRDTGTQTRLDADARRENVRGAFAMRPGARTSPFARYVLIDDVFTTGSTLSECARALRRGGALEIDAATFAHG